MKDAASFFKVLADEARLSMLWLLFNHKELCVCDFIKILGITQSRASRHLRILHRAGLLDERPHGLWRYYSLRPLKDGLVNAHLKTLCAALAGSPEASDLRRKLSARIGKLTDGGACCEGAKP